jgi:hypothetical protein
MEQPRREAPFKVLRYVYLAVKGILTSIEFAGTNVKEIKNN